MRAAWRIASKDLLLRVRDRSAFIVGIVVPLALAFIFNLVFGGAFGDDEIVTLGVADGDQSDVSSGLVEALRSLEDEGTIGLVEAPDLPALEDAVDDGEAAAGLYVPPGLGEAAMSGSGAELTVVSDVEAPTAASIARGVAASFATRIEDSQRVVQAVLAGGGAPDPSQVQQIAQAAATAAPVVTVGGIAAADRVLDPTTFFAASMAVFFVFFMVQFGVTGLLDEEMDGTLTRLHAAPIPRWAVIVGKAITSLVLGVVAMGVLAIATSILMGANWGDPLGVAILIVAVVLAATSIIGLVASLVRTPEAAGNLVAIIAVGMGMLGGTFFPVAGGNEVISTLSLATPHSWFLRGLGALHAGDGVTAILPSVGALLVFGLGVGVIAALLLRRRFS